MITTNCEKCCFMGENKQCILSQFSIDQNGKRVAPGLCRLSRSEQWKNKQDDKSVESLTREVLKENELKFDLIVLFDETQHDMHSLENTLDNDWYEDCANRIIIADTTGINCKRKNMAFEYINNWDRKTPIYVDSSAEQEPVSCRENTIKRISKMVKSKFFMTLPAGKKPKNIKSLQDVVQYRACRTIYWPFPFACAGTFAILDQNIYGLFMTCAYRSITKKDGTKSFSDILREEEKETGLKLSWVCDGCECI